MFAVRVIVWRKFIEMPDPVDEGPAVVVGHGSNARSHHHSATEKGLTESIIENLNLVAAHGHHPSLGRLSAGRSVELHHQRKPGHMTGNDRIVGVITVP